MNPPGSPKLTNSRYEVAREKMKAQGKLAVAEIESIDGLRLQGGTARRVPV